MKKQLLYKLSLICILLIDGCSIETKNTFNYELFSKNYTKDSIEFNIKLLSVSKPKLILDSTIKLDSSQIFISIKNQCTKPIYFNDFIGNSRGITEPYFGIHIGKFEKGIVVTNFPFSKLFPSEIKNFKENVHFLDIVYKKNNVVQVENKERYNKIFFNLRFQYIRDLHKKYIRKTNKDTIFASTDDVCFFSKYLDITDTLLIPFRWLIYYENLENLRITFSELLPFLILWNKVYLDLVIINNKKTLN